MRRNSIYSLPGEIEQQHNINVISGSFLSGIFRTLPRLSIDLDDSDWANMIEAGPYSLAHADGSSFEISLSESDKPAGALENDTAVEELDGDRKVTIRHNTQDGTIKEAAVGLQSGYFTARSSGGELSYAGEGGISALPYDGSTEQDVYDSMRQFARDFAFGSPEYIYPEKHSGHAQLGSTATAQEISLPGVQTAV